MWSNGDSTFSTSVPAVRKRERYTVNRLREQLGIQSPNVYTLLGYDGHREISTWSEQVMQEVGQYIERTERFKVAAQNFAFQ